jgi:predicted transcriptional regulator
MAKDITRVLIYAISPVQQIIGEFGIGRTVVDHPETLWAEFGDVGSIDQDSFDRYYEARDTGVAFTIAWAKKYASPQRLAELDSSPAIPQSFSYLQSPSN